MFRKTLVFHILIDPSTEELANKSLKSKQYLNENHFHQQSKFIPFESVDNEFTPTNER